MRLAARTTSSALTCAMTLLASACGQTGDLYLPDPPPAAQPPSEGSDRSPDASPSAAPGEPTTPSPSPTP